MYDPQQLIANGFKTPTPQVDNSPSLWSKFTNWLNGPTTPAPVQPTGGVNLGVSTAMPTISPAIQNAVAQTYAQPAGPVMIQAPAVQKPAMQTQPAAPASLSPIYSPSNNGVYQGGSSLPPEGSPEYAAAQASYNASKNFPTAPAFNINTTNTNGNISGDALSNTGSNYGSAYGAYNSLAGVASKIFDYSQYSPEELQAKQNLADLNSKILAQKFAATTQINDLAQNGAITKEQAQNFINETSRRADEQSALLGISQNAAANNLGVLTDARKTTLGAYTSLAGLLQPTEVSPGSTLYNPITGVGYQGTGAAPAQIFSTAQTLKQNDQMTGNLHVTPQGTVDDNYYYQQAQAQLSGRQGGQSAGAGYSAGGVQAGGLPANLQPYVVQSSTGQSYINADKIPASQLDFTKQQAAQAGVPVFSTGEVESVRNIDYVKQNIQGMDSVINNILSPGLGGRTKDLLLNPIKNFLQSNTDISTFNGYRDTAIKIIQSLAGGPGSGLRLTGGEIATATSNIPTITDNLETAQNKIKLLNTFLDTKLSTLFPNSSQGMQSAGTPTIVQTSAGAINTNW